jgi:putative Holliday junction resolvase
MRILGVDLGARRIGLAVSDETATLARPWQTVEAGSTPQASAAVIAGLLDRGRSRADDDAAGIGAIVVGLPRRLNGEDTGQSQPARDFAAALADQTGLAVRLQDERLSSIEADSRLAVRERDWRRRKARLDAAAAAVILQDYLDQHAGPEGPAGRLA